MLVCTSPHECLYTLEIFHKSPIGTLCKSHTGEKKVTRYFHHQLQKQLCVQLGFNSELLDLLIWADILPALGKRAILIIKAGHSLFSFSYRHTNDRGREDKRTTEINQRDTPVQDQTTLCLVISHCLTVTSSHWEARQIYDMKTKT